MEGSNVSRVTIRIPPFWPDRPALWFAQVEVQFSLAGITNEVTKFSHVVAQLDSNHAQEVEDVIINPPAENPFQRIKEELIQRLSVSQEQRIRQLLEHEELGDRKPSQFLRHLRTQAGVSVPDGFLRTLWLNRLPSYVQSILVTQDSVELGELAKLADKIHEVTPRHQVASTSSRHEMDELRKDIAELTRQVAALTAFRPNSRGRPRSKSRQRGARSPSEPPDSRLCWYHATFGARARKCRSPCEHEAENRVGSD
ncbi:uncharacterized protein [Hetaerina americana]|uniref:uncharacterized protein n=1 Tax=Hetaerina americana TaxID=62018 RepID=UPI003A7F4BF4